MISSYLEMFRLHVAGKATLGVNRLRVRPKLGFDCCFPKVILVTDAAFFDGLVVKNETKSAFASCSLLVLCGCE